MGEKKEKMMVDVFVNRFIRDGMGDLSIMDLKIWCCFITAWGDGTGKYIREYPGKRFLFKYDSRLLKDLFNDKAVGLDSPQLISSFKRLEKAGLLKEYKVNDKPNFELTEYTRMMLTETLEERRISFKKSLIESISEANKLKYGENLQKEFYLFWTEPDKFGIMKFESQSHFSFARRMATWYSNKNRY